MTTTPDPPSSSSRPASPGRPSASRTSDKAKAQATDAGHDARSPPQDDPQPQSDDDDADGEAEEDSEHASALDNENDDSKTGDDSAHASGSGAGVGPAAAPATTAVASAGDWQAVFSPAHNAYYFYNTVTHETTWTNPLVPASGNEAEAEAEAGPSTSTQDASAASLASAYALQAAAAAQGIDPALAYLDPSLAGPSGSAGAFDHIAKFNARTGAFTRADGRDPSHLSEYERAKRMSMAYFDVGEWEKEVAERDEQEQAEGKKRKRPTKKDLERFKEQKRLKKIAKTAWLRT